MLYEVKGLCMVWSGGKDGDYIKFLFIVINVNDERKCGDFK